jgi:hypothetical protein
LLDAGFEFVMQVLELFPLSSLTALFVSLKLSVAGEVRLVAIIELFGWLGLNA